MSFLQTWLRAGKRPSVESQVTLCSGVILSRYFLSTTRNKYFQREKTNPWVQFIIMFERKNHVKVKILTAVLPSKLQTEQWICFPLLDRRSAQITAFELLTQKVWMTSHNEIRRIFFQKFETLNDLQNTSILNKIKFPNSDKKRHDHLTTLKFVAPWPGRSSFNITTPTSFPPPTHPQHTPAHTLSPNLFLKPKSPHTFSPCSWQKNKKKITHVCCFAQHYFWLPVRRRQALWWKGTCQILCEPFD